MLARFLEPQSKPVTLRMALLNRRIGHPQLQGPLDPNSAIVFHLDSRRHGKKEGLGWVRSCGSSPEPCIDKSLPTFPRSHTADPASRTILSHSLYPRSVSCFLLLGGVQILANMQSVVMTLRQ